MLEFPHYKNLCSSLVAFILIIVPVKTAFGQTNGQCTKTYRDITLSDGSARIRAYSCHADGTQLRVEFFRLSEIAIGSILLGKPLGSIKQTIGNFNIANNKVYTELRNLFEAFGNRSVRHGSDNGWDARSKIDTPRGGTQYTGYPQEFRGGQETEVWDICQGAPVVVLDTVPIARNIIGRRRMTPGDLNLLATHLRRFCKSKDVWPCGNKYPMMLAHMGRSGAIPGELLTVEGHPPVTEGCGPPDLEFLTRPLVASVLIVTNESKDRMVVNGLLGDELYQAKDYKLRPRTSVSPSVLASKTLPMNFSLSPGEVMLLFTSISLGRHQDWGGLNPEPVYSGNEFNYGPEVRTAGLAVGEHRFVFEETSANYLEVTATGQGMSCPFLYAWDERTSRWVAYGKVLHEAHEKRHQMTQTIKLGEIRTRFRLGEEEPERSHIDQAAMILLMRDGSRVVVKPSTEELEAIDSKYLVIEPFQSATINFQIPPEVDRAAVSESFLSLTGYYERTSIRSIGQNAEQLLAQ